MPSNNNYIAFECQRENCGNTIRIKPPMPGKVFIVTCPKCFCKQKWQYEGINSDCQAVLTPKGLVTPPAAPSVSDQPFPPASGRPECVYAGPISYGDSYRTDPYYRETPKDIMPSMGRLMWERSGFIFTRRERYDLMLGQTTIGQRDPAKPSTVMFDDKFMSRQSVKIEAAMVQEHGGYKFTFTLLKSLNPAYYNEKELKQGDVIPMTFGDKFRIGSIEFTFEGIDGRRFKK